MAGYSNSRFRRDRIKSGHLPIGKGGTTIIEGGGGGGEGAVDSVAGHTGDVSAEELITAIDGVIDTNFLTDAERGAISSHSLDIASLESQTTVLEGQFTTLDNHITALDSQVDSVNATVTSHSISITSLGGQVTALDTQVDSLGTQVATLDGEIDTVSGSVTSLGTTVSGHTTSISTLNTTTSQHALRFNRYAVWLSDFGLLEGVVSANGPANSDAWDAAVAYCVANSIRVLMIPFGFYYFSRQLKFPMPPNPQTMFSVRGMGMRATTIRSTAGFTDQAIVEIAGIDPEERIGWCELTDVSIDGTDTTNISTHGLYIRNATSHIELRRIHIQRTPAWGLMVDGDTFFIRAHEFVMADCGRRGDAGNGGFVCLKGVGTEPGTLPVANGNHFSNFTISMDSGKVGRRVLHVGNRCTHNVFRDWDVQSYLMRLCDASFYIAGAWNKLETIKNYDGLRPFNLDIASTSSGTSSRIRCTTTRHGLDDGMTIEVAGITGGTGIFGVDDINASSFDLVGTVWSGVSEVGTWKLAGNVTGTGLGSFGDADRLRITTAAVHGLYTGQRVILTGITDAPAGPYRVYRIDPNNFDIDPLWNGVSETGVFYPVGHGTDRAHISTNLCFDSTHGTRNICDRFFGFLPDDQSHQTSLFWFLDEAIDNQITQIDRAGGGVTAYYADDNARDNKLILVTSVAGEPFRDVKMLAPGSAKLLCVENDAFNSMSGFRPFVTQYGWYANLSLDSASLLVGSYVNGLNVTGSARFNGYPGYWAPDSPSDRTVRMGGPTAAGTTTLQQLKMFSGAIVVANDTLADTLENNSFGRYITEGRLTIVGLDSTGAAQGTPIYIGTSGGYTLTVPTTGYAIKVGWVVSPGDPTGAIVLRNPLSEMARNSRLGMQRFTTDPTGTQMSDEEVSVGVVGGVGRFYYKSGGTIYSFSNADVASGIAFTPAGTIAATNVQAAIAELDTETAKTGHTHNLVDAVSFANSGRIAARISPVGGLAQEATPAQIQELLGTWSINAQTGTAYTLALTDRIAILTMDNALPNAVTIPTNAAIPFPVGSRTPVIQLGVGVTTIDADVGVTLNGVSGGAGAILAQFGEAYITKIATDTWLFTGSAGVVA